MTGRNNLPVILCAVKAKGLLYQDLFSLHIDGVALAV